MDYQTKFLLKKGVHLQHKHLRVKSVFNEISNLPSQRGQIIKPKRRNALVPVPRKDEIAAEHISSKPYRNIKCCEQPDIYQQQINEKEYKEDQNYQRVNYLKLHKITIEQSEALIDWMMVQVKRYQRMSFATLFLSVELVDQFLSSTKGFLLEDLQLIGSCCIYLSSKFLDLYPICVEDVFIDICLETYTIHDFLQMEQTICRKLNYNLLFQTPYQYFQKLFESLRPHLSEFYDDGEIANMKNNALDLLQFSIIGYEFRSLSHYNKAIACIYEVVKLTDRRIIQSLLILLNHIEINFNQIQLNGLDLKQFSITRSESFQSINNYFF